MVRTFGQASILYKLWYFLQKVWEILMLFIASVFQRDPRDVDRADATPLRAGNSRGGQGPGGGGGGGSDFRSSSYRPGGSGGGGSGGGSSGGSSFRPGRNIRGLGNIRNRDRIPMGGG